MQTYALLVRWVQVIRPGNLVIIIDGFSIRQEGSAEFHRSAQHHRTGRFQLDAIFLGRHSCNAMRLLLTDDGFFISWVACLGSLWLTVLCRHQQQQRKSDQQDMEAKGWHISSHFPLFFLAAHVIFHNSILLRDACSLLLFFQDFQTFCFLNLIITMITNFSLASTRSKSHW